jgi:hypothetical protein
MACNSLMVREEEHNNQLGKLKHIENVDFFYLPNDTIAQLLLLKPCNEK